MTRVGRLVGAPFWPVAVRISDSGARQIGITDHRANSFHDESDGVTVEQILEAPIRLRIVQCEQRTMESPIDQVSHHSMLRRARQRLQYVRSEQTEMQRL